MTLELSRSVYRRLRAFFHRGDKYICPFCGYSSRDLAPFGLDIPVLTEKRVVGAGLRQAGCYNCGSFDRERLVYLFLLEKMHFFDSGSKSILHIAPERNLSEKLRIFGDKYVCGDLFAAGYQYPKHVRNINVLDIPFADNTFDLVICNHVLEHIVDDIAAMKELKRVMNPSGAAILQVPISRVLTETLEDASAISPAQREPLFGQSDHVRIYAQDYPVRLEKAGFKVRRENISTEYFRYGLNVDEDIFICGK